MRFPAKRLRTGLPVDEALSLAQEAASNPEWMHDLIAISSERVSGTASRKASWIIRHAAMIDAKCVQGRGRDLMDAVDASMDPSVHRELLKASGVPLSEEVREVWTERGATAETPPLARFLSKQIAHCKFQ